MAAVFIKAFAVCVHSLWLGVSIDAVPTSFMLRLFFLSICVFSFKAAFALYPHLTRTRPAPDPRPTHLPPSPPLSFPLSLSRSISIRDWSIPTSNLGIQLSNLLIEFLNLTLTDRSVRKSFSFLWNVFNINITWIFLCFVWRLWNMLMILLDNYDSKCLLKIRKARATLFFND